MKDSNSAMPARSNTTPVLMYHKVGATIATPADRFLNVPADAFARQMRLLARLGYTARPFAEVVEALQRGQTLPPRHFAITFDDGYACIGHFAAPVLKSYGFPATVFVVSEGVGQSNVWDELESRPLLPLMDWPELRELMSAGWEIGGHTRSHPHLDALDDAAALADIRAGREATEAALGVPLTTFCYPFGHLNARTPALVQQAGFRGACTTRSGIVTIHSDPYRLPRVKIASRDGSLGLLYRLLVRPYLPTFRSRRRSETA